MPTREHTFRADPGTPSSTRLDDSGAPHLPEQSVVRFHRITSADGTLIEAWHNDAWHRGGDGPVVLLCNGLGTNAYSWPDLLRDDCDIRVISWNHRGVGRSARPTDPDRCGVDAFVEDAIAVMDAAGVESAIVAGLVDRGQHRLRARRAPPRAGARASSPSPGCPAAPSSRCWPRCSSRDPCAARSPSTPPGR